MAGPVSLFEHFPIGWARQSALPMKASRPDKPVVKVSEKKEGIPPVPVSPKAGILPESTEPQYRKLAVQQAPAKVGAAQTNMSPGALTRADREAIVKNLEFRFKTKADLAQHCTDTPDNALSICYKTQVKLQGHKPSEITEPRRTNNMSQLDVDISGAIEAQDETALNTLLDAHPHVGRRAADNSVGTFLLNCFRTVASWFGSAAFEWQRTQTVRLLNQAAGVGNAEIVQILLDRCMDLEKHKPMIKPALWIAVESGNVKATSLLLSEVIREDPGYVKNTELSTKAARLGHRAVLEVLVEQGMALPPKRSWRRYDQLIKNYLCWFAAGKTTAWSGFEAERVQMILDSNAGRYIPQRDVSASARLAKVIADEFKDITTRGEIREDLLEYLMDQGMYGVLANLVVDAASSTVKSPSWDKHGIDREKVFADALNQSARDRTAFINQARVDSGAPDLFDALLSPQLHLINAYQESDTAQDAAPSTRKRRATL